MDIKQIWGIRSVFWKMAPTHHIKGRLTQVQRMVIGYSSTKKDRKAKKVERQRRRLGRLHNGRK